MYSKLVPAPAVRFLPSSCMSSLLIISAYNVYYILCVSLFLVLYTCPQEHIKIVWYNFILHFLRDLHCSWSCQVRCWRTSSWQWLRLNETRIQTVWIGLKLYQTISLRVKLCTKQSMRLKIWECVNVKLLAQSIWLRMNFIHFCICLKMNFLQSMWFRMNFIQSMWMFTLKHWTHSWASLLLTAQSASTCNRIVSGFQALDGYCICILDIFVLFQALLASAPNDCFCLVGRVLLCWTFNTSTHRLALLPPAPLCP